MPGRLLFALAIGYLVLGYALAGAGLAGLLNLGMLAGLVGASVVVSLPTARGTLAELARFGREIGAALAGQSARWTTVMAGAAAGLLLSLALVGTGVVGVEGLGAATLFVAALLVAAIWRPASGVAWLLAAWLAVTSLAALAPPSSLDYDGLAERLAHAKVYARTGHYAPLWYDHHSHFPALTQMLFTAGMLVHSPGVAKLFHWAFGLIGLLAAAEIARRFVSPGSGKWAALVFAGTPVIGWLMQVGYVDLTTTAYGLLAVLAVLEWRRRGQGLALGGLMAAGMMASKMQGIPLFGVLLVAVAVHAWRHAGERRGAVVRAVLAFGLTGALVASPWYVKTWVLTGNPVYPFAYSIFGGKYWGEGEARAYAYDQKSFGMDHLPAGDVYERMTPLQRAFTGPRSPRNLLLAPWNLTVNPVPFSARFREGPSVLLPVLATFWIGPLYLLGMAGLAAMWLAGKLGRGEGLPPGAGVLLWLFAPLWAWWLMSMQLERYLLPSLVLLAPATGVVWQRAGRTAARALPLLCMATALGAVSYLSAPSVAVVSGMLDQDQYLQITCPVYAPSKVLNRIVPPGGKVISYGEPRGFYIDADYMWGDPGHHRLIPYEELRTPEALVRHLRGMGITHVLISVAQTGGADAGPPISTLYAGVRKGLVTPVRDESVPPGYVVLELNGNDE